VDHDDDRDDPATRPAGPALTPDDLPYWNQPKEFHDYPKMLFRGRPTTEAKPVMPGPVETTTDGPISVDPYVVPTAADEADAATQGWVRDPEMATQAARELVNQETQRPGIEAESRQEAVIRKVLAEELDKRIIVRQQDLPPSLPRTYKTPLARNIDRLRHECGWSLDQLAEESGIAKQLILRHINQGKNATPRILKKYAQAFSRGLNRSVLVEELLKPSA
jgi:Helix-turn-helix